MLSRLRKLECGGGGEVTPYITWFALCLGFFYHILPQTNTPFTGEYIIRIHINLRPIIYYQGQNSKLNTTMQKTHNGAKTTIFGAISAKPLKPCYIFRENTTDMHHSLTRTFSYLHTHFLSHFLHFPIKKYTKYYMTM